MGNFIQELKLTIRSLRKRPSFSIVVLLTLIVGIAACSVVFTVVHSVLLRPLPFRSPDRIAVVPSINQDATGKEQEYGSSLSDFLDWRKRNRSFEALVAMQPTEVAITGNGDPEQLEAGLISANLFDLLGVRLHLGRSFRVQEEVANSNVVILSHGFWRRRFGGRADVLGKSILVDGVVREIVGITPPEFFLTAPAEAWLPLDLSFPRSPRTPNRGTAIAGRLRPGVSFEQATGEMQTITAQMAREFPVNGGWSAKALPIREPFVRDVKDILIFLAASVAFLLVIVCVNVANLVLIRHMERRTEMVLRLTLGASKIDLWKHSLYENILLTIVAALFGLFIAKFALNPIVSLSPVLGTSPAGTRILNSVSLDSRAVAFTFTLSILIALTLSMLPLLRLTGTNLFNSLKSGAKGTAGVFAERRFQNIFVIAQLSISFLLLIAAMLTFQNFHRFKGIDPGFKVESLMTAKIALPATRYDTHEKRAEFQTQLLETARSIPGVLFASTTTRLPLNEFGMTTIFDVDGIPPVEGGFVANFRRIGAGYLETMKTPVLEGREFNANDSQQGMPVAIVSRQMAKRFWPGESAIGKRIRRLSRIDASWRTVVGVVGDMKDTSLSAGPELTLYTPYAQGSIPAFHLVIRTSQQPDLIFGTLREKIRTLDKDLPLYKIATAEELFIESLSRPRFAAYLLATFALLGIFVALIGVYGVVSYSTNRRVNEIGIRMAVGAQQRSIIQLILEQSLRLSLWGILFGLTAALILERSVTTMWSAPGSVNLYLGISAVMVLTGLIASFIPAIRATRVDPVIALRYE